MVTITCLDPPGTPVIGMIGLSDRFLVPTQGAAIAVVSMLY